MKSSNVCNLCTVSMNMEWCCKMIWCMSNNLKYLSCWKYQHSQQDICYNIIWVPQKLFNGLHLRLYSAFIGHSRVDIICSLCCYVVQNNSHSNFVNKCFHDERQNNRYPKHFSFTILAYSYWYYLSYYGVTYNKQTINAHWKMFLI